MVFSIHCLLTCFVLTHKNVTVHSQIAVRMLKIAAFIAAAALLVGLLFVSQRQTGPVIVPGFVEADEIRVGSRIGGRVSKVHVEEGSQVISGSGLAELEAFDRDECHGVSVSGTDQR